MEDGKKVYVSSFNGPFLNSDALIVEYDDILQIPEFFLLYNMKLTNTDLSQLYDTYEFYKLDDLVDMINWYANRKYQSLYLNFKSTDYLKMIVNNMYDEGETFDKLLYFSELFSENQLMDNLDIIEKSFKMSFFKVLKNITKTKLVKKVMVFSKYNETICKEIEKFLQKEIRDDIKVISARTLKEVNDIEEIMTNSTFVFSNMYHIAELIEIDKINKTSIILSDNYSYNKIDGEKYVIDLEKMKKDFIFKINFFNNYITLD